MFNLKSVYATLNFENSKIKLLVVEKNINKTNCLFYDEVYVNYLDGNMKFINVNQLHSSIVDLLKKADNFLGIVIKRYIINISCLPLKIKNNWSPKFLLFDQVLTWEHYNNYLEKLKNINVHSDEYTISIIPQKWLLDNVESNEFPASLAGNEISFQYNSLNCKREVIQQWFDLIDILKIKILCICNNSLAWTTLNDSKNNYYSVLDIKSKSTIITTYRNNEVFNINTFNKGSNYIIQNIKAMLKIDENINILPIMKNLCNLNLVQENIAFLNKYSEDFLTIQSASSYDMKYCFNKIINKLLDEICLSFNEELKNMNILLNVNDDLFSVIDLINLNSKQRTNNIELIKTNVIGLETNNIANILASVNYTHLTQKLNEFVYSIDSYISPEISLMQTKQNFILKLGLVSTKWAAKLGE